MKILLLLKFSVNSEIFLAFLELSRIIYISAILECSGMF